MLHKQTVRFGDLDERISVVDDDGNPLAVDKGGRLQRDFSNTTDSTREEIMDALEKVMHDLTHECGLATYLMYGCLLGAVRNGRMIGHDSDADVAYLSLHTHPFDIIRECTAATRRMRSLGWKVVRMSGANFKVWVPLPDGRRCGIDVFGSFHIGERFYVTGSLTGRLDRSALLPFGTVTLEGREITAPARPEQVLEFTYGPDWRVPGPCLPLRPRPGRRTTHGRMVPRLASPAPVLARLLQGPSRRARPEGAVALRPVGAAAHGGQRPAERCVLDVGAGTGRDASYFASRGHRVVALDFSTVGMRQTKELRRKAADHGGKVSVRAPRRWRTLSKWPGRSPGARGSCASRAPFTAGPTWR